MASTRKFIAGGLAAAAIAASGVVAPVSAGEVRAGFNAQRLDEAPASYAQWRGYSRGARGAVVAGAVGAGLLGAAAIAATRPAYAEPVYDYGPSYGYGYEPGYAYGSYAPVYEEPVEVYRPSRQRYYGGRGPYADTYRGAPDPARGGK